MSNILTNKADLLTSDGTNDQTLAAAANGFVNVYDSTQTKGFSQKLLGFQSLNEVTTSTETYGTDTSINQIKYQLQPNDALRFVHHPDTTHVANQSVSLYRHASYSGTQGLGFVNSGLYVATTVDAGANTNEWSIVGKVINSGSGNNVGVFGQGYRSAGTGNLWGAIGDFEDFTGSENAGAGIGGEFDCFANGVNTTYQNRIGVMAVSGTPTGIGGAASQCWFGMYVTSFNGGTSGYYKHGVYVGTNESMGGSRLVADIGMKVLADGTYGYVDNGSKTTGFYADGAYSGPIFYGENTTNIGSLVGNTATFVDLHQKTGTNTSDLKIDHIRTATSTDWTGINLRIGRDVGGVRMGSFEFRSLSDFSFNRSLALTMDGNDYIECNLLRDMSVFSKPINMKPLSANPVSGTPFGGSGLPNPGECNQYIKGGKMVYQYNDSGTIRYITTQLSGTGSPTPVKSTTAP